ncbi:prepilin-type N-terminal cleavage/methylation domain-containing protein [Chroococcidiopsis sp. FACHB-1243]|nr:hormogonium polysaccharide secretion pseudopilin HpsC [Chroococcidiopsis sp. [FACHB-1243]]MBD2308761.1 prepilin-type N-terminal cleavage/methylation domain-containing protein [Chroococcidiopsis sp. [FACHB-1243]]
MIHRFLDFCRAKAQRRKERKQKKRRGLGCNGFTLIELLVSIVISSIVLSSLLSFMTNMLTSERREQAKSSSEQEIQLALDYISRDLQEAIYIYDADGIQAIADQLPHARERDKVPVLVFWKPTFLAQDRPVTNIDGVTTTVGCLTKLPRTDACSQRDYFVYSLVIYYLIKDNNPAWSGAARIGRLELQDGIRDTSNSRNYLTNPAPGFQLFNLSQAGTLKEKMNAWEKADTAYNSQVNPIEVLVDYVDPSPSDRTPKQLDCQNISSDAQLVPDNTQLANPLQINSFYACVDASRNLAQVYLRGSALIRLEQNAVYSDTQASYFPSLNIQVKSRGTTSSNF